MKFNSSWDQTTLENISFYTAFLLTEISLRVCLCLPQANIAIFFWEEPSLVATPVLWNTFAGELRNWTFWLLSNKSYMHILKAGFKLWILITGYKKDLGFYVLLQTNMFRLMNQMIQNVARICWTTPIASSLHLNKFFTVMVIVETFLSYSVFPLHLLP